MYTWSVTYPGLYSSNDGHGSAHDHDYDYDYTYCFDPLRVHGGDMDAGDYQLYVHV